MQGRLYDVHGWAKAHESRVGDYSGLVSPAESPNGNPAAGFGPNEWMVDEIYHQYLADRNSVDPAWWDFFADYKPSERMPAPAMPTKCARLSVGLGSATPAELSSQIE